MVATPRLSTATPERSVADHRGRSDRETVDVFQKQTTIVLHQNLRRPRPTMAVGIIATLTLTAVLANTVPWLIVLLVYVTRLRSRKSDQRARLASDLGISTLTLKDRKVVGFFHPFW